MPVLLFPLLIDSHPRPPAAKVRGTRNDAAYINDLAVAGLNVDQISGHDGPTRTTCGRRFSTVPFILCSFR